MSQTLLKPQGMDATTRLASKILYATRDYAGASGDVPYTGVGFVPTSIICLAFANQTVPVQSVGFGDSAFGNLFMLKDYDAIFRGASSFGNRLVVCRYNGTTSQEAIIKSYNADGFTLTWTKTGSPTGTIELAFLCFR